MIWDYSLSQDKRKGDFFLGGFSSEGEGRNLPRILIVGLLREGRGVSGERGLGKRAVRD